MESTLWVTWHHNIELGKLCVHYVLPVQWFNNVISSLLNNYDLSDITYYHIIYQIYTDAIMISKFTKTEIFSHCVLSESTDTKRYAVCQILEEVGSYSQTDCGKHYDRFSFHC